MDIDATDENSTTIFEFINALGQVVYTDTKQINKGINTLLFDVNTLEQGVFFIKIQANGTNKLLRFIKL